MKLKLSTTLLGLCLATWALALVPPASAHYIAQGGSCGVNIGDCGGGSCDVNYGDCSGGDCTINRGSCISGECTVNLGLCYNGGDCPINLPGGQCGPPLGASFAGVGVVSFGRYACTINVSTCESPSGECLVNLGMCTFWFNQVNDCLVNAGDCTDGACTVNLGNCGGDCLFNGPAGVCDAGDRCIVNFGNC